MFVILGMVLLIGFIILTAIIRNTSPPKGNIQEILKQLQTGSVKNHVTTCILQTSMDGLESLGANGGVIYNFEAGTIPFEDKILGRDYLNYTYLNKPYFVDYALKRNTLCENVSYKIPDYPCLDTPFNRLTFIYNEECLFNSFYSAYDGFFGQNNMSKLCYIARESTCEGYAKGIELALTLQKQLEDYIANTLPLCIDLSAFSSRLDANITVEAEPVVESTIHNSDILVVVKYPVKINFKGQDPITTVVDYQVNLNIRLGLMYNFIYNLYSRDSKNIDFNLNNEFISSSFWRQGLELKKINNPCTTCPRPYYHDDIVEVLDRSSMVKGRPFLFRTAVENRKPALDKLEDVNIDLKNTNFVNIRLNGYDPDDTGLTYYFLSLGKGEVQCAGAGGLPAGAVPSGGTGWCESDARVSGEKGELVHPGLLWMPIDRVDIGSHEVGVLVIDDSGLFDYQFFRINITDSSMNNPPSEQCIDECILEACSDYAGEADQCKAHCYHPSCQLELCDVTSIKASGKNPYKDCSMWCFHAANACNIWCDEHYVGPKCFPPGDNVNKKKCRQCAYGIMHSGEREKHVDCSTINSKAACINNMPNCFWVEEEHNNFVGACFNDTSLNNTKFRAYIITE